MSVKLEKIDRRNVLIFSRAEDARIKREMALLWEILMRTTAHIIATKSYQHFELSPEIIRAIENSWHANEPVIIGRFDLRYKPKAPVQAYEINVMHAGNIQEKIGYKTRLASLADDTCKSGMQAAWRKVSKAAAGRKIIYYADPGDFDAKSIRSFATACMNVGEPTPLNYTAKDVYALNAYTKISADTFLTPPAWTILIDNKVIWYYAWMLNPEHRANLIPTFLDPSPFVEGGEYYRPPHTYLMDSNCVAKPANGSQGFGQFGISNKQQADKVTGHLTNKKSGTYVFQAWLPEPICIHKDPRSYLEGDFQMFGYAINNRKTFAYKPSFLWSQGHYVNSRPLRSIITNPARKPLQFV